MRQLENRRFFTIFSQPTKIINFSVKSFNYDTSPTNLDFATFIDVTQSYSLLSDNSILEYIPDNAMQNSVIKISFDYCTPKDEQCEGVSKSFETNSLFVGNIKNTIDWKLRIEDFNYNYSTYRDYELYTNHDIYGKVTLTDDDDNVITVIDNTDNNYYTNYQLFFATSNTSPRSQYNQNQPAGKWIRLKNNYFNNSYPEGYEFTLKYDVTSNSTRQVFQGERKITFEK